MKKICLILFGVLTIFILTGTVFASDIFIKVSTGYNFNHSAVWKDAYEYAGLRGPLPVYGEDFRAKGNAGKSMVYGVSAGILLLDWLDVSLGWEYIPDMKFKGEVNFPDAGENQPVSSKTRINVFALKAEIYPFRNSEIKTLLNPFIGLKAGLAYHNTSGVKMYFPELKNPHHFITPKGDNKEFMYSVSAGNSFSLSKKVFLDLEFNYSWFGNAETGAGAARIERGDDLIILPVEKTKCNFENAGIKVSIKYFL